MSSRIEVVLDGGGSRVTAGGVVCGTVRVEPRGDGAFRQIGVRIGWGALGIQQATDVLKVADQQVVAEQVVLQQPTTYRFELRVPSAPLSYDTGRVVRLAWTITGWASLVTDASVLEHALPVEVVARSPRRDEHRELSRRPAWQCETDEELVEWAGERALGELLQDTRQRVARQAADEGSGLANFVVGLPIAAIQVVIYYWGVVLLRDAFHNGSDVGGIVLLSLLLALFGCPVPIAIYWMVQRYRRRRAVRLTVEGPSVAALGERPEFQLKLRKWPGVKINSIEWQLRFAEIARSRSRRTTTGAGNMSLGTGPTSNTLHLRVVGGELPIPEPSDTEVSLGFSGLVPQGAPPTTYAGNTREISWSVLVVVKGWGTTFRKLHHIGVLPVRG